MDINIDEKVKDKERESHIRGQIAANKLRIFIAGTSELILLITEIYTAIHYKGAFIAMALFALGMVIGLFFLVNSIIDLTFLCKELEKDNFDDIYRAQKASYLVIRKSFEEMDERLKSIEESSSLPADEIINAQKAVAKVTISRSKENTDALMNSNDELINHLFSFEGKLDSNNEALVQRQKEMLEATRSDIAAQNADLTNRLNMLQMQMQQMETKIAQGVPVAMPQMVMPQMMPQVAVPQTVAPQVMQVEQPVMMPSEPIEVPNVPEEPVSTVPESAFIPEVEEGPIDFSVLDDNVVEAEPSVIPDPVMVEEPAPVVESIPEPAPEPAPAPMPVDDDPNKIMSPDDIAALLASMNNDAPAEPVPEPEPAPAPAPMPVDDDPNKIMSPDDIAALLASMNNDAPAEPEPVPEPAPAPVPVDDDPNKIMSPDDIAALLASMNSDAPAEEPAPEPVVSGPDLSGIDTSDPNRVMSPEEIEKLFASL